VTPRPLGLERLSRKVGPEIGHIAAYNYAESLRRENRYDEIKALLRGTIPVARRALGDTGALTLSMRSIYAAALYEDPGAALDDLVEAVETLEETTRTARRVLGGAHPHLKMFEGALRKARAALAARETPSASK
jgi:hypothetical protein